MRSLSPRCLTGGVPALSLILFPPLLMAADRTWDGGDAVNVSWVDADNWNPNVAPTLGDRLIFPSGVADVATNNNFLAGVNFLGLEFTGDNYSVAGSAFVLGASGIVVNVTGTGDVDINPAITLNSDQIWSMSASDTLTLGGTVNVGTRQLTFTGAGNAVFDGGINGTTGAIIVGGSGNVTFNGAKSFAGPLTINANGGLTINHSSGLGTLAEGTSIDGILRLGGGAGLIIAENLELSGAISSSAGGHSLTGGVALSGTGLFTVTGGTITTTAVISGTGSLQKNGAGEMVIAGASPNTYGGATTFFGGLNTLQKPAGVTAIPSSTLTIGNGIGGAVELRLNNPEQINDNTTVGVDTNGTFNLYGRAETVASVSLEGPGQVQIGTGTLKLGGATSLTTTASASVAVVGTGSVELLPAASTWTVGNGTAVVDLLVEANVSTAQARTSLTKNGAGTMQLNGDNTVPVLTIEAGGVILTGDSSEMRCELNGASAVLNGTGWLGDITSLAGGGALALSISGTENLGCHDLALNAATTLHIELQSNAAYDRLSAYGTVNLGGANLALSLLPGFSADTGDEFLIIFNDGEDLITGTFAGLPEGTYFNAGGQDFHITYTGGLFSGKNNVVLTRVVAPTGNTKVWSGLSAANSNWTTAANWVGGVVPVPGDQLVFPAGASRLSNTNNYAAGTTFHAITIEASGYTLSGNQVVLNAGLTATHGTAGVSTVNLALRPAMGQTFFSNGGLTFAGAIDLYGKELILSKTTATGNMVVNGVISGSGRLRKEGDGSVFLNAANTYVAGTIIEAGVVDIQTPTSLGTTAPQVRPGGTLLINSSGSINGPANTLQLEGTLISSGSAPFHSWLGEVVLVGSTPVINVNTPLTISGWIRDYNEGGGFTKTGTSTLRLSGSDVNTFKGGLTINQGMVELAKTAGVVALPGPVTVGDGTGTDTLRLINADQIADTATVHLNRGVFDLNGHSETIATLDATGGTVQVGSSAALRLESGLVTQASAVPTTITGWVRCGNDMTWTIADGPAGDDLVVNAMFDAGSPTVTLRKEGPGRMVIAGTTVIPAISVAAGTVRFTGIATTQFNLDGGTLDGTGFVSRIISSAGGGTVAPGLSTGRLTCTQTVWNGQTTFAAELLSSATAGTTYDQLTVNGTVNLGGAALQVIPLAGFTGSIGDTFIIIDNDAADAVTGTFAGLPAGSVVTAGAFAFSISYTGGTGNDVVLTRVVPPVAPDLIAMAFSTGTGPGGQDVLTIGGTAAPGTVVTLQASTDLVSWTDVLSVVADGSGVVNFTVNQTPGISGRLFRIKP